MEKLNDKEKEIIKKIIDQIATIQLIDDEKHKYFSQKASIALEDISNGNYISIIELQSEITDFLQHEIEANKAKDLPTTTTKTSLFNKVKKSFSKKSESEITKIADMVSVELVEDNGFIPDKRTVIYDWFDKMGIRFNGSVAYMKASIQKKKICNFINSEGHNRSFSIEIIFDEYGYGIADSSIISINDNYFEGPVSYYYGEYGAKCSTPSGTEEIMSLIDFYLFTHSKTEDKTFINELGKEIEKVSIGDLEKAGKKLKKTLRKNPVLRETKKSFDKAAEEYAKTEREFRLNELNRKEAFNEEQNRFKIEKQYTIMENQKTVPIQYDKQQEYEEQEK